MAPTPNTRLTAAAPHRLNRMPTCSIKKKPASTVPAMAPMVLSPYSSASDRFS